MEPTRLIATYSRVSTSHQEEQKTIQTQLLTLKEFAEQHHFTIVREYIDDGWSGDVLARPALDKLRHEAKAKLWDAVLVYDPDRLARRYSYQELVMDELKEAGIEIIFVTIAAPKNSEDKILHGVRGLFAEYERAKISERFRLGKLRKIKEGHILVSEALYGYRYIPKHDNRHGYYEINPEEAKVVKQVFSWVGNDGLTTGQVVKRLAEVGIKPRKSKRNVWNKSTIRTLLRHRGYIGQAHWGSTYATIPLNPISTEKYRKNKKSSRRIKPEDEWYLIDIPAIIDPELFKRTGIQLERNRKLADRNKKREYLLSGKIRCACGRSRTGEGPQGGKYLYYRCSDRVSSFPLPPNCNERGLNAPIADDLVWKKLSDLMTSPELLTKQVSRWQETRKAKGEDLAAGIPVIEKDIQKLKIEEERYNKAYGTGLFSVEQLGQYLLPIREKISSLEMQIRQLTEKQSGQETIMLPNLSELEQFVQSAKGFVISLSFEAKRAIILRVVEKVVATRTHIQVVGKLPVTAYSNVGFKTSDRHGQFTTQHSDGATIPFDFKLEVKVPIYKKRLKKQSLQKKLRS